MLLSKRSCVYPIALFVAILLFLFIAADGLMLLDHIPCGNHTFRQSDCVAYTKRYYTDHRGLFSPACYNLIGKDGRVVSEFPILYYISAQLCKVLGFHFWIIRGITAASYAIGLFYLFLCIRFWIKDITTSILPVILFATSPYLFFYAINFLPNVPAITLSFAGLYYMLRYEHTRQWAHLLTATLLFILTTLLKPTDGGLIWLAYMATQLATPSIGSKSTKGPLLLSSAVISAFILAWYLFVRQYNLRYDNDINLQSIFPIWRMSGQKIWDTITYRLIDMGPECFHHPALLFLLLGMLVVYIVRWQQLHVFLRRFTLMLIAGALAYALLWYEAFYVHDYYQLLFAVPAVFLCIAVLEYLHRTLVRNSGRYIRYAVALAMAAIMTGAIYDNQYVQQRWQAAYPDGYMNAIMDVTYEAGAHLQQLGLCPQDRILSVPDHTPNISLAALGLCGYTSNLFGPGRFDVPYAIANGVRYMVILDTAYLHDPLYAPYTTRLAGQYKHIQVYDLWASPIVQQGMAEHRYDTSTSAGKIFTQWREYRGME